MSALVLLQAVILFFGTTEGVGPSAQLLALGLLVFGGLYAAVFVTPRSQARSPSDQTVYVVIGILLPTFACISAVYSQNWESVQYSIAFLLYCGAVQILATRLERSNVLQWHLAAYTLLLIIAVGFEFEQFASAMLVTETDKGLVRFSPFGNHPNLTGHTFGCAASLAFGLLLTPQSWSRRWYCGLGLVAFSVAVLAASSRGALLSMLVASLLTATLFLAGKIRSGQRYLVHAGSVAAFGISMVVAAVYKNADFFLGILDVRSEYRGLGSGGTGRLENWSEYLAYLFQEPVVLFMGEGFRTWSIERIGFDSDNAYLNLTHEVGVFLSIVVVGTLVFRILRVAKCTGNDASALPLFSVLAFVLVESVFARYLLGIGNAASFLILYAYFAKLDWPPQRT